MNSLINFFQLPIINLNMSKQATKKQQELAAKRREEHIIAQTVNPENYIEKPRPNTYNVIRKLRENEVRPPPVTL